MKDHLVATGRWMGGPPPFGYRLAPAPEGRGKVLQIAPDEAAAVRTAADIVLGGGSLYAAMQALTASGVPPRRARAWSISSVHQILTGDAILGRVTHRGAVQLDAEGMPEQVWPAVLSVEDVERIRAVVEGRRETPENRPRRATRVLSGLVRCHSCGSRMRVNSTGRGESKILRYHCGGRSDGNGCAQPVSMACEQIEGLVVSEFLRVYGRFEVVDVVEVARPVADFASVEEAIRRTSQALAEAEAEEEAGVLSRLRKLKQRRTELEAMSTTPVVEEVRSGETFAARWERLAEDIPMRRALLSSAIERVVVSPGVRGRRGLDAGRVRIEWATDAE